jgi:hypothetical protein
MKSLLGHGGTNGISPSLCAIERGRAEQQTGDSGCEMRLFVQRSGEEKRGSGFTGHWTDGIVRKRRDRSVLMRVSRFNSSLARSLLRGFCDALRHGTVLLSGLLSQSKSGPLLQNARLGTWESRPLA